MKNAQVCTALTRGNFVSLTSPEGLSRNRGRAAGIRILPEVCTLILLCAVATLASASPTFKALVSFNGTNGSDSAYVDLVQGIDGDLYGTTQFGGAYNQGTVFKIDSAGNLTTLWSFCKDSGCPDGNRPAAGLTIVTGGNLYGTTYYGGAHGAGTVFKITPAGALTTVHSFCGQPIGSNCVDGSNPDAPLLLAADGNLYGTTVLGGNGGCGGCHGGGIAFKFSLSGVFTKIHDFCTATCTDYGNPSNSLMQAADGNFYGEIYGRYAYYAGNIFRMTPAGKVTLIYTFCKLANCTDGVFPSGGLVQGANGSLYGTTAGGGQYNDGEFFEITTTGTLTVQHSFANATGNLGLNSNSGVILGFDGNFYGVTYQGGTGNCVFACGTVFSLTPTGSLTTLYSLDGNPDGTGPWGLVQDTNGTFYGTTLSGGGSNAGTVYTLADGLGPFVKLVTTHGKVGTTVDILGQGLTGTSKVAFDGVPATFNIVSGTFITAVVPDKALTGKVTVTTSAGTYHSSKTFNVTPQFATFSPAGAIVGAKVTLTGVSLTQTSAVTIGGKAATFTVVSDTEVTAVVPAGAKTGQTITIKTAGGSASKGSFAVDPHITSFTPASGPVGTQVTITGTTFTGTSKVSFGGVDATSFQVINDSEVKASVPTGAQTGPIAITTSAGTATSSTSFTVN
jgi:uncharacterized repeat protein (TIGR03803 family)